MPEYSWYIVVSGVEKGPVSTAKLKELAQAGKIKPDRLIRREDQSKPVPATKIKGLLPAAPKPAPKSAAGGKKPKKPLPRCFYVIDDQSGEHGPYEFDQLLALADEGRIDPNTRLRNVELDYTNSARRVKGLFNEATLAAFPDPKKTRRAMPPIADGPVTAPVTAGGVDAALEQHPLFSDAAETVEAEPLRDSTTGDAMPTDPMQDPVPLTAMFEPDPAPVADTFAVEAIHAEDLPTDDGSATAEDDDDYAVAEVDEGVQTSSVALSRPRTGRHDRERDDAVAHVVGSPMDEVDEESSAQAEPATAEPVDVESAPVLAETEPEAPAEETTRYYVSMAVGEVGPYTVDQLEEFVEDGDIEADDRVRTARTQTFVKVGELLNLVAAGAAEVDEEPGPNSNDQESVGAEVTPMEPASVVDELDEPETMISPAPEEPLLTDVVTQADTLAVIEELPDTASTAADPLAESVDTEAHPVADTVATESDGLGPVGAPPAFIGSANMAEEEPIAEEDASDAEEPDEPIAEEDASDVEEPDEPIAEEDASDVEEPDEPIVEEDVSYSEPDEEVAAEDISSSVAFETPSPAMDSADEPIASAVDDEPMAGPEAEEAAADDQGRVEDEMPVGESEPVAFSEDGLDDESSDELDEEAVDESSPADEDMESIGDVPETEASGDDPVQSEETEDEVPTIEAAESEPADDRDRSAAAPAKPGFFARLFGGGKKSKKKSTKSRGRASSRRRAGGDAPGRAQAAAVPEAVSETASTDDDAEVLPSEPDDHAEASEHSHAAEAGLPADEPTPAFAEDVADVEEIATSSETSEVESEDDPPTAVDASSAEEDSAENLIGSSSDSGTESFHDTEHFDDLEGPRQDEMPSDDNESSDEVSADDAKEVEDRTAPSEPAAEESPVVALQRPVPVRRPRAPRQPSSQDPAERWQALERDPADEVDPGLEELRGQMLAMSRNPHLELVDEPGSGLLARLGHRLEGGRKALQGRVLQKRVKPRSGLSQNSAGTVAEAAEVVDETPEE